MSEPIEPPDWATVTRELDREDLIYAYTHGHCGVLALVLNQELGWPVYGVFGGLWHDGVVPMHAIVRNPVTKRFTDARGSEQTEEQMLGWYRTKREAYIEPMLGNTYFGRPLDHYAICRNEHVDRLLPGLLPRPKQLSVIRRVVVLTD